MKNVKEQKLKLEQKKNRLIAEETKLRLKERKARTRHLIEIGGLVVKANLDSLPTNTLYGALLSLSESQKADPTINEAWTKLGKTKFDEEQQLNTPVIVKFEQEPAKEIREAIRAHGLRFNRFRSEWYGNVANIEKLKTDLSATKHDLEIIPNI